LISKSDEEVLARIGEKIKFFDDELEYMAIVFDKNSPKALSKPLNELAFKLKTLLN
jgi:hypothetical protein